ncbi:unnamed protein product [Litomosoides sigmodontis]|uniref:Uncharacterized protein n=1 Tax=Litomosoides sigmodontis TaxID=42156 RepID=A0A3P6T370_LITSI|nr:unnamed protein product [Litomosoides sigmodontis]
MTAPVSSLRNFISKLQDVLAGEEIVLGNTRKVTSASFAQLRKKLVIASETQYNKQRSGFPPYLQVELIMSNIGLTAVDTRWFGATSLRVLDLSGNKLGKSSSFETRFLNVARLQNLRSLLLADNGIQCISDTLWNALPKNLLSLDLSNNEISYLSPCCMRFPHMVELLLNNNKIEELPRTIRNLKKLKCLDISWNNLKFLPSEIKDLSLETIDVTAYSSEELELKDTLNQLLQISNPASKVGTLFEYSAAAVFNYRISTELLSNILLIKLDQAVQNCKNKRGGGYRFYPASIVTTKYHIEDIRSLAFEAVSRTDYNVILQDMEVM